MKLSSEQFEQAMAQQQEKSVTLSHCGSFNHSNVYEKFSLEHDNLEYRFKDLIFDDPDEEMMLNSVLKHNIVEIQYLWFSNQIELILRDGNKLLIDLCTELDI